MSAPQDFTEWLTRRRRAPFDPLASAALSDGSFIGPGDNRPSLWLFRPDGSSELLHLIVATTSGIGSIHTPMARGDRWVAPRVANTLSADPRSQSGFLLFDHSAQPQAFLPIKGGGAAGGGHVVGWVNDSTVLLATSNSEDSNAGLRVIAWNVDTGRLWRAPSILPDATVSVAFP